LREKGPAVRSISEKMITFVKIWISMAGELQQIIDRVNAKTQILLSRYAEMDRMRKEAMERVMELEAEIGRIKAENERLSSEVEYLRIATTIIPDRNDVGRTRALLSELVREIDKCIAELND